MERLEEVSGGVEMKKESDVDNPRKPLFCGFCFPDVSDGSEVLDINPNAEFYSPPEFLKHAKAKHKADIIYAWLEAERERLEDEYAGRY